MIDAPAALGDQRGALVPRPVLHPKVRRSRRPPGLRARALVASIAYTTGIAPAPPNRSVAAPSTPEALVTGAGGGIGRAICDALARAGMRVTAADLDDQRSAEIAREVRRRGGGAVGVGLDVTDAQAVEALVAEMIAEHGRIDVLVNLAGVLRNQLLVRIDDADFDIVMDTHLRGTLNTMRAALPHMREAGYGRIVNMSSIAARGSVAGASYGAAKAGIEGLTRTAALETAARGITVNCVAPGLIAAGMFVTVPEDYQREQTAHIPMKRLGTPEEVADCVAFLASAECSYVTGQTLSICGGLSVGF